MAQVTFTIDDANLAEFKTGFLRTRPVPLDTSGNPTMTENNWIREFGRRVYMNQYRRGKQEIAETATVPVVDETIIS